MASLLGTEVTLVVEVERFAFRKWRSDGRLHFISPLPSPFAYGSVPGELGGDGDPLDVILLGASPPRGAEVTTPVRAVARFVDEGEVDDKLICKVGPLTAADRALLVLFFAVYAPAKRAAAAWRGARGPTRFLGLEEVPPPGAPPR